jgi:aspartokinase-like uncharacterized kinase
MKIFKFGGSLINHSEMILKVLRSNNVLIVPGGGVFADSIRSLSTKYNFSQEASHRMAILAMHQYGIFLSDLSSIPMTEALENVKGPAIILPFDLILASELGESWDVTSDSIACYIAYLMGEKEFIKATDVDGVVVNGSIAKTIEAGKLLNINTCVDKRLPSYLQSWNMNCRVINGKSGNNIKKALKGEPVGTLIIGDK